MKVKTFLAIPTLANPDGDLETRINEILDANKSLKFISATFTGEFFQDTKAVFILFFEEV